MNIFIELSVILILGGCNVQLAHFNHSKVKSEGDYITRNVTDMNRSLKHIVTTRHQYQNII